MTGRACAAWAAGAATLVGAQPAAPATDSKDAQTLSNRKFHPFGTGSLAIVAHTAARAESRMQRAGCSGYGAFPFKVDLHIEMILHGTAI
jgi:hypothetical protein